MKKSIISTCVFIMLFSCQKNTINENNTKDTEKLELQKFTIDSVKVADSSAIYNNLTISFAQQLLVFREIKDKVLLDSIYKPAVIFATDFDKKSLQNILNHKAKEHFVTTKRENDFVPEAKQTWDQESKMKLISNTNNILTISYSIGGYTGGAHGFYNETYKVFDLENNKVIHQEDIFNNTKDTRWSTILMNHFNNKDQKEMLLEKNIPLNNNFFFDKDKITFVYNQYEITAYAAGVVYISIPFKEIEKELTLNFKEKLAKMK
jgi:hypothetical protein